LSVYLKNVLNSEYSQKIMWIKTGLSKTFVSQGTQYFI